MTGEIPRSDLVLPQQAARPRRGGVAQELGQRRVYYADPDIYAGASVVVTRASVRAAAT